MPVSPDYALTYDGNETENLSHSISNVNVNHTGDVGLFGAPSATLTVSDLSLIDFSVTGTGNAGALAGTLVTGSTVTNVLAYNTADYETSLSTAGSLVTVSSSATDSAAGGLVGAMGQCTVTKSAAALVVSGNTYAGGLIGKMESGTVSDCYSGGHLISETDSSDNATGRIMYNSSYNVTASSGTAGGLVGSAGSAAISHSYSTCSASGTTVGGLVGTGDSSASASNCYATGLVYGTTKGAFAGTYSGSATGCQYFEQINEVPLESGTKGFTYLTAVHGAETTSGITAFDADVTAYKAFVGEDDSSWTAAAASPYNSALITVFEGDYGFPGITNLDSSVTTGLVTAHYGDWPAPELLVLNTAG